MISLKLSDKPKQYEQDWVEFYKLKFKVTPDVLIPRPETELLVDEVLKFIHNREYSLSNSSSRSATFTILDIGTGAGNIAISLAKNLILHPCWVIPGTSGDTKIIATDVSAKALKIAKQNAKLHGVLDKIQFVKSNLLSAFSHSGGQRPIESTKDPIASAGTSFVALLQGDNLIIVTNLPYIPSERIPYLDPSVKDFEPHVALDGGSDGFDLYRKLFSQIKQKGWNPKLIVGEIDYTQGDLAYSEAKKYFPEAEVKVKLDLSHKQRILLIQ